MDFTSNQTVDFGLYFVYTIDRGGVVHVRDNPKWGNSQGLRIPKALLDAVGLKEHDRVELVQMDDGINIRRASSIPHRTLEERLTAFYGKPIDQIDRIEAEELDWGKAEGSEAW